MAIAASVAARDEEQRARGSATVTVVNTSEPWEAVRVGVRVRLVGGTEARVENVEDRGGHVLSGPWRNPPAFFMVYVPSQDLTVRVRRDAIQEVLGE
jgi:hypothetical protein